MKFAILMALSFFSAPYVHASGVLTAPIERLELDAELAQQLGVYRDGTVTIDLDRREAGFHLVSPIQCPPHALCLVAAMPDYEVTLPIVSIAKDACGSVTTVALQDLRPVDGGLQKLTITDNRANRCPSGAKLRHETEAVYETSAMDRIHGAEVNSLSRIGAGPLSRTRGVSELSQPSRLQDAIRFTDPAVVDSRE